MQKLVADGRFMHNGKMTKPGEEIEASDQDAADLIAMNMATRLGGMARALNKALDLAKPNRHRPAQHRNAIFEEEA